MNKTRLVLFNKPIWFIPGRKPKNDIRKVSEVWGFNLATSNFTLDEIQQYVTYLCCVSKWQMEGNTTDGYFFDDLRTGVTYHKDDISMQIYGRKARKERGIKWELIVTNKDLSKTEGMIEGGSYVASRRLCEKMREYGAFVDVKKLPIKRPEDPFTWKNPSKAPNK